MNCETGVQNSSRSTALWLAWLWDPCHLLANEQWADGTKLTTYFCPVLHACGNTSTPPFSKISFLCNVTHSHSHPNGGIFSTLNQSMMSECTYFWRPTDYLFKYRMFWVCFISWHCCSKIFSPLFHVIQLLLVAVKKDRCPDVLLGSFQLAFENIRQITSHTPLWSTTYPPVQNQCFKRRKLKTGRWGWENKHYNLKCSKDILLYLHFQAYLFKMKAFPHEGTARIHPESSNI